MERKSLENLIFEDHAWVQAEYPRLHMKTPEKFKFFEMKNFDPIEVEIHLSISYHHGKSQWVLDIYTYKSINCSGTHKYFNSIQDIKQWIEKKYKKIPVLPERWN